MKKIIILFIIISTTETFAQKLFKGKVDVVSFTYRKQFEKDVPGTLDIIRKNGITDIEFSNLFGKTAKELRAMLDERKMTCSSFGVGYADLVGKTDEVAANAKTLGAKFVRTAWIPHKDSLTVADTKKAIEDFNSVGKLLKEKYDLTFVYHNHGYEFRPYKGADLYDYIMKETNPNFVSFELDILWAFFPGQNPAAMLTKYGSRYKLMHMKDLKKGVVGDQTGGTAQDNDVALGTGQIDIPSVIRAAQKAKIAHYYLEDESSNIEVQVPQSIRYLNGLKE